MNWILVWMAQNHLDPGTKVTSGPKTTPTSGFRDYTYCTYRCKDFKIYSITHRFHQFHHFFKQHCHYINIAMLQFEVNVTSCVGSQQSRLR